MAGRPKIEIVESVENLQVMLKQQKRILEYNKVLMLYLFKTEQVQTVREVAKMFGKSEPTIHRWLAQYRKGGIDNLLTNRQTVGRPKKFSVETVARIQRELRDPEGFSSYKEVDLWLRVVQEIQSSYGALYRLIRYDLKSKLKVARPRSVAQKEGSINFFKNTLNKQLESLLEKNSEKLKKYSKVSFWCSDETRMGLHTIQRRKLTLCGVKPEGKQKWDFDYFWLYGAIDPKEGRSLFFEFSHLDKVCFSEYLALLSQAYSEELLIVQVDNAPSHISNELEIPENIILLFQPPYCPEVNPIERLWEYIKNFLAWDIFFNLEELRIKVANVLSSLTNKIVAFLTGWSWILHSLSLSQLY